MNKVLKINNFSKGIDKRISKNITDLDYAVSSFNFDTSKGVLSCHKGIKKFIIKKLVNGESVDVEVQSPFDSGEIRTFLFEKFDYDNNVRKDKLIVVKDGSSLFYYLELNPELPAEFYTVSTINAKGINGVVNYNLNGEDVLIFSTENENMIVWNGLDIPHVIATAPKIRSMCMHYERLFVTTEDQKNTLWFSDDLNPINWNVGISQAGFIDLPSSAGRLLKVVSFMDYVYVFREYGINRISAYAKQDEFYVNELFVSAGRIFADSVCVCGDKIIFLAEDGLYLFDGLNTKRIFENLGVFDNCYNQFSRGEFLNGKFYLMCNINFDDVEVIPMENDSKFNAILELDLTNGRHNVYRGLNIVSIMPLLLSDRSELVACVINSNGSNSICVFDNYSGGDSVLQRFWKSPETDFLTDHVKVIDKIYIRSSCDVTVSVIMDGVSKDIGFVSDGVFRLRSKSVRFVGQKFGFEIRTNSQSGEIGGIEFRIRICEVV